MSELFERLFRDGDELEVSIPSDFDPVLLTSWSAASVGCEKVPDVGTFTPRNRRGAYSLAA
jgi:hypothetical protein